MVAHVGADTRDGGGPLRLALQPPIDVDPCESDVRPTDDHLRGSGARAAGQTATAVPWTTAARLSSMIASARSISSSLTVSGGAIRHTLFAPT